MKKFLIVVLSFVTLTLGAQTQSYAERYLTGAVPEREGLIVFTKAFQVPGKTKAELHAAMRAYLTGLIEASIPAPTPYARLNQDTPDTLAARCCEWMVFKKKPLYLDRTRFRYQVNVFVEDARVRMEVCQISYYYEEDNEGNNGKTIRAEEWISDREAINRAGTKLYPRSGKFRRFTIDRVQALFEGAMDLFEMKAAPAVPQKRVRRGVVEE